MQLKLQILFSARSLFHVLTSDELSDDAEHGGHVPADRFLPDWVAWGGAAK
jgi:hypothetical protein